MSAKPSLEDYTHRAKSITGCDLDDRQKNRFNVNAAALLQTAESHPFMSGLSHVLEEAEREYRSNHDAGLFSGSSDVPTLHLSSKSFDSSVNKEYRNNVLWNRHWPEPPTYDWKEGAEWVHPSAWYETFNDLVRGTLVCRYIDGPKVLAQALAAQAESLGLRHRYDSRQSDEGYYAYHFYVYLPGQIVDQNFDKRDVTFQVEIQLTTQLQDALRELTHRFYEAQRITQGEDHGAWKWDVSSNRFRASYLGHTLHLLESVILQVKDNAKPPGHDHD